MISHTDDKIDKLSSSYYDFMVKQSDSCQIKNLPIEKLKSNVFDGLIQYHFHHHTEKVL